MTTVAFRLPEELIDTLDYFVNAGSYRSRTAAVKAAIERFIEQERGRAVDQAIVDGYKAHPPEPADSFTRNLAARSVSKENW